MANSEVDYILSRPEHVFTPGEAVTTFDDFYAIGDPQPNWQKSFRCGICGGVYNRKDGVFSKGKWYCTILECSEDAQ
jgi:hypothetical protein